MIGRFLSGLQIMQISVFVCCGRKQHDETKQNSADLGRTLNNDFHEWGFAPLPFFLEVSSGSGIDYYNQIFQRALFRRCPFMLLSLSSSFLVAYKIILLLLLVFLLFSFCDWFVSSAQFCIPIIWSFWEKLHYIG